MGLLLSPRKKQEEVGGLGITGTGCPTSFMFSYVGVLSSGARDDISDKLQGLKKAGVKFYYIGCGESDSGPLANS